MKLTLRLVTIICYFLPCTFFFTNCTGGLELRFAYNQAEADKNVLLENEPLATSVDTMQNGLQISNDTTKIATLSQNIDTGKTSSDSLTQSANLGDKVLKKVVMPTDTSLSGIGSIFLFKNLTGKIAIGISILISLSLLILFKFLKSQKIKLYLLLTGTLCLTIFIVDSYISNVTLLWGVWTLFALLLLQLVQELNGTTKAYR